MKLTYALLLTFLPLLAWAQQEGRVFYDETIQIKIELPDDAPEEMKKMLPPSQQTQQVLFFNEKETLYRNLNEGDDNDLNIEHNDGEGGEMQIKIARPQNVLYRDIENDKVVESRDFMGRTFLIKDETAVQKWKLSPEKKKILNYNCQKAILQDTSKNVVVWFTTEIPVSAGPETFHGLPGLILEADMDNGMRKYVATKAEMKPLEKEAIVLPSKGKSCTRAEYDKIVADKMKEMNAENGGGGMKIIIRERN